MIIEWMMWCQLWGSLFNDHGDENHDKKGDDYHNDDDNDDCDDDDNENIDFVLVIQFQGPPITVNFQPENLTSPPKDTLLMRDCTDHSMKYNAVHLNKPTQHCNDIPC